MGSIYAYSADLVTLSYVPLACLVITLLIIAFKYLTVRSTSYSMSTERLQVETGLLSRSTEEIELYRVRDWSVEKPFLLRLVGQGTVKVVSNDATSSVLELEGVKARTRFASFSERTRKRRARRSACGTSTSSSGLTRPKRSDPFGRPDSR